MDAQSFIDMTRCFNRFIVITAKPRPCHCFDLTIYENNKPTCFSSHFIYFPLLNHIMFLLHTLALIHDLIN